MTTYAATIDFNLSSDSQEYKITKSDETILVTIALGEFVNISENISLGYTASLEYDESIFESVTVTGKNGWYALYSSSTHIIEGDSEKAKENTTIAELNFKLKKEYAKQNETTTIKLKDILLTDGDFEIKTNKEIKIKLMNEKAKETIEEQQIKDITMIVGEKSATTTSSIQNSKLPSAGIGKNIILAIIILCVAMIIFKIKARKIK